MVDVKSMFEELLKNDDRDEMGDVYKLRLLPNKPTMFLGIDTLSKQRQVYIVLGNEEWTREQISSLPKWRGIEISTMHVDQLGPVENEFIAVFSEVLDHSGEIFEMFVQNLIDNLLYNLDDELFTTVYKVLERWKIFFSRKGSKRLNTEQQQGLFGELKFISDWINANPGKAPLMLQTWEGPNSNRIDFVNGDFGVEVKTSKIQLNKKVKISNERQLYINQSTSRLFLLIYFVEENNTYGISLQRLVDHLRNQLLPFPSLKVELDNKLIAYNFEEQVYCEKGYFVESMEVYEIGEDFPRITPSLLPAGVSHVSYEIDLDHCRSFIVDKDIILSS